MGLYSEFVLLSFFFVVWHSSKLLSCVGRNLFEAEVGPVHCYLLASLFCRVKAKPKKKKKKKEGAHLGFHSGLLSSCVLSVRQSRKSRVMQFCSSLSLVLFYPDHYGGALSWIWFDSVDLIKMFSVSVLVSEVVVCSIDS